MQVENQINPNPAAQARSGLSPNARRWGRKLFELPVLSLLRPLARRAAAVAEVPDVPGIAIHPQLYVHRECISIGVMSANLCHDWPRFRLLDERLEAFVGLVKNNGVDILLLQEVARKPGMYVDQWLSERLGMSYVYSRANGHRQIGFEEGLAIFSRFPLSSPSLVQLGEGGNPFVRRLAIGALVGTPCGDLQAFSVHLGLRSRSNSEQVAHLHRWVGQLSFRRPALVGGDFNSPETSLQIRRTKSIWMDTYREANPQGDGHTHTLRWPWGGVIRRHRLDYIFLNPAGTNWHVLESRHLSVPELAHSDHHAVLTRLAPSPPLIPPI